MPLDGKVQECYEELSLLISYLLQNKSQYQIKLDGMD